MPGPYAKSNSTSQLPVVGKQTDAPNPSGVKSSCDVNSDAQGTKVRPCWKNISIKAKLLILATTSVAVALLLAFSGMAANDINFIRKSKIEQLQSQAQMLAFNSSGVLGFGDIKATEELLSSLALYPHIEYAAVFNEQGDVFAEYNLRKDASSPTPISRANGVHQGSGFMEVIEKVSDGTNQLGSVYIRTNLSDFYSHIRRYLLIALGIMVGSLLAAATLTLFLQKAISAPINKLADAAKTVKDNKDFSVRVEQISNDELGQLSATFNAMLDEIETSKAALQSAHDDLEDQVAERTLQLREEIEQRKVIQTALEQARDGAEAASRSKSEFLANMSHEIRTPLNGILGFTELLSSQYGKIDEATEREYIKTITSSGEHLLALINDILDLSKIEAGQLEVELSPISPHDVINQVVSVLRARAQQKGLSLKCTWKSAVPESIVTDGGRLRQLLMNLIGNAIKFTQRGSVSIEASLRDEREVLDIRVVDTGIGIPHHKQADIFDPFVQADNSVTRQYGGTGLGLAISKKIAKALGGSIQVLSEEGRGSTFTLQINTGSLIGVQRTEAPIADALVGKSHGKSHANTADESDDVKTKASLPPCKVLLVEDGVVNRKLVQIMLVEAGAQVETAENGWVGYQLASKKSFDLILMDMQMPVMDGYTATKKLRDQGIEIPIIALTAHAMKGDDQKCIVAGCTSYLTKPIQAHRLISAIAAQLEESPHFKSQPIEHNTSSVEPDNDSGAHENNQPPQIRSQVDRLSDEIASLEHEVQAPEIQEAIREGTTTKQQTNPEVVKTSDSQKDCFVSTLPLGNPIYQEIVNEFVETLEGHVADMRAAYSTGDFENLNRLAHGLKGAGGTAGFDVLTSPSSNLQKCTIDAEPEHVEQLLDELTMLVKNIRETPQVSNPAAGKIG